MAWIFRVFDALHGPGLSEIIWHVLTRVSALSETEINATSLVLGTSAIQYGAVRVAHGGFLGLIFRLNRRRAFTWNVGRTRIEYAKSVNIGGYVCKYITKMGGWSDEALAFIWKKKIRMYSYSRCYTLPVEEKLRSDWQFYFSTKRARIINNPYLIIRALPDIENLEEFLEAC